MFDAKEYYKKYYRENKNKLNKISRDWYKKNKYIAIKRSQEWRRKNLESWRGFLPSRTKCQICGKVIYLNKTNVNIVINFDHRSNGIEAIEKLPTAWLRNNMCTEENKKIWNSCNFGMVCQHCNFRMPTKNRKEWWINVGKYMGYIK